MRETSSRWNSPCSTRTAKGAVRPVLYGAGSVQRSYGEYRKRAGYKHFLYAERRATGGYGRYKGLMQGASGYLAKKFRTVKVKLKAGYRVMLYAKQQ